MTLQEIRLLAVLGHLAIGIIALVVALVAISIARFAQKVDHPQAMRGLGSSSCGAPFSGRLGC